MAKRGRPRKVDVEMDDVTVEPQMATDIPIVEPVVEEPKVPEYIPFKDSWLKPGNDELRQLTTMEGQLRIGDWMTPERKKRGRELLKELKG